MKQYLLKKINYSIIKKANLDKRLLFILLFWGFEFKAQSSVTEIDTMQTKVFNKLVKEGDFNGVIVQERKFIEESKKRDYKKGEIRGCINIANVLNAMKRNRESLKFLEIATVKLKNDDDDNELQAYLHYVYGKNYYSLELYERSIKSFNIALEFAEKIKNKKEREKRIYSIYDWKRSSFEFLGMMDSVYSTEHKCMRSPMPMLYITIAERHYKDHNIDSAEYYVNKANNLLFTKQIPLEGKANVLRAFGRLNIEKRNYAKALDYLLSSLEITQKAKLRNRDLESYKLIAKAYKGLDNLGMENEYLSKYSNLNDSLQRETKAVVNTVIEKMLTEQEENERRTHRKLYYIIFTIISISGIVIYLIYNRYKTRQKLKDTLINQKVLESEELKRKLDNTYEELIHLAVHSDPSFMNRFKELYPEFYDNLTSKYESLTLNDMKLCAFIKLNFSNKEIAEYDHISLRTVESKKYRLRKKLNLSGDIDFNKWVMEH
ncbi:helix-turn-helix transcriptional regulator [Chryseobacterium limigenitum]|uniref:Regulatory protein, luxR family n=1 Tax=Chryseobacterium limigenitum TaxID=1612149 RepID=A0A1K2IIU4_9FLAO|nr:LuxR C-terminal-related transcriptional regulator [Chryseobacterium limigenitum]SFZ92340.1 regulatory protein, luxR family [Chryseobacterium limigenitum]